MRDEPIATGPQRPTTSVTGHAWPVVPLSAGLLLLRTRGDETWALWTATALGVFGLVMAGIAVARCVGATRDGAPVIPALGVVLALLVVSASFVWTRVT
jgi:ABC-type enterochelin transport system permease subunit